MRTGAPPVKVYRPTAPEDRLLREWLADLQLLNIESGALDEVIKNESQEAGHGRDFSLQLTAGFRIGSFRPITIADGLSTTNVIPFLRTVLISLYERSWINHMMATLTRAVQIDVPENAYYQLIAELMVDATLARGAVVRALTKEDEGKQIVGLNCLAVFDRTQVLSKKVDDLHLHPEGRVNAFDLYRGYCEDLQKQPESIVVLQRTEAASIFEVADALSGDSAIQTIIIAPMSLGGLLSGLVTLIYDTKIELSDALRLAFLNVANPAAAAIENFRTLSATSSVRTRDFTAFLENLHLELMQGFRHVAGQALAVANSEIRRIGNHYSFKGDQSNDPLENLKKQLLEVHHALDNMRSLHRIETQKEVRNIVEAFDDACRLMGPQLREADVTVKKVVSGDMSMSINYTAVRTAFANLILNSVQALTATKKTSRAITLTATRSSRDITIMFSDNGPGIRLGTRGIQALDDIWLPGKTRKDNGTGYGLPMVREVFQSLHHGSINLVKSSPAGVVFRITLRADQP